MGNRQSSNDQQMTPLTKLLINVCAQSSRLPRVLTRQVASFPVCILYLLLLLRPLSPPGLPYFAFRDTRQALITRQPVNRHDASIAFQIQRDMAEVKMAVVTSMFVDIPRQQPYIIERAKASEFLSAAAILCDFVTHPRGLVSIQIIYSLVFLLTCMRVLLKVILTCVPPNASFRISHPSTRLLLCGAFLTRLHTLSSLNSSSVFMSVNTVNSIMISLGGTGAGIFIGHISRYCSPSPYSRG